MFGKMDPFCKMTYQGTVLKTTVKDDAGKKPKWNQKFDVDI